MERVRRILMEANGASNNVAFFPVENGLAKSASAEERLLCEQQMEQKFRWPRRMLLSTGLVFYCEPNPLKRAVKCLFASLLVLLATYQTGYLLRHSLQHGNYDLTSARSLVYFNWMLQCIISMGFLFYWQLRGYMHRLQEGIHCPRGCASTKRVIKRTVLFYLSVLILTVLFNCAVIVLKFNGDKELDRILDDALLEVYGHKRLVLLAGLVQLWAMYVWVATLTFFVCMVTALENELSAFSNKKLRKIGEMAEGDMAEIGEELQEHFIGHVELANRVRNIDSVFEVYTFAMIGSNVPTSIICLLSFLLSVQNSAWLSMALSIPDLMFCLLELVGLTSSPAKVHARIREVESIIYGNMRIWQPFNEKVYRLATVFIAHANQSNLGITLWGFAVVTKPLILTTISLTVTYLTFILQVRADQSGGAANNNGTIALF